MSTAANDPPVPTARLAPADPAPTSGSTPVDALLREAQKPGYATTEFWMSAFAQVSALGLAVGLQFFHWNDDQVKDWSRITGEMASVVALLVSFLVTREYVNQRGDVKKLLATAFAGRLSSSEEEKPQPDKAAGMSGSFTTASGTVVKVVEGLIVQIGEHVIAPKKT